MKVKVFAPATVANVAVGFDILGFAVDGVGDIIEIKRISNPDVVIAAVEGIAQIPLNPKENTATIGLLKLIEDKKLNFGFELSIKKGIPLGSGLGGSAASAVGAIFAANLLLDDKLSKAELLKYALEGESYASGSTHADNVAPCLFGGLNLIGQNNKVTSVPYPDDLICILVHPDLRVDTKDARKILSQEVSLKNHIRQSSNLAGFLLGCFTSNMDLIKESLTDVIIEPQRSKLIPHFDSVKQAALDSGALGCSISGSGPTMFAFAKSKEEAESIKLAIESEFHKFNIKTRAWLSCISKQGVKQIEIL